MTRMSMRMNAWSAAWTGVAFVLAGAILLWLGLALVLVLSAAAGLGLLISRLRGRWKREPEPRGPLTIEGTCSRVEP